MASVEKILAGMVTSPAGVKFADLAKVCEAYFGKPRNDGSSHHVYKTPWKGDPRVNIQSDKGKVKAYQVKQVLAAINKLNQEQGT